MKIVGQKKNIEEDVNNEIIRLSGFYIKCWSAVAVLFSVQVHCPSPTMAGEILKVSKEEIEEELQEEEDESMTDKGKDGNILSSQTVTDGASSVARGTNSVSSTIESGFEWVEQLCGLTPSSRQGQLVYMLIMLLIPILPIFGLITQNVIALNDIILKKVREEGKLKQSNDTF